LLLFRCEPGRASLCSLLPDGCRVLRGQESRSGCGARRVVLDAAARERSCGRPWPGTLRSIRPRVAKQYRKAPSACTPARMAQSSAPRTAGERRSEFRSLTCSGVQLPRRLSAGWAPPRIPLGQTPRASACEVLGRRGGSRQPPNCRVSTRHPGPVRIRASPVTVMIANGCARSISPAQTGYGQASSPFAPGRQRHADATSMRLG